MEPKDIEEESRIETTTVQDKLPHWLEDMSENDKEDDSSSYLFEMNTDLPSRLLPHDNTQDSLGDGFIKIAKSHQHEIRHGRRASQGAVRSISKDRSNGTGPLSRSADYATRRSSAYSIRSRSGNEQSLEKQLEQSWSSLSFFNQTQRGRLSAKNTPNLNPDASSSTEQQDDSESDVLARTARLMERLQTSDTTNDGLVIEGRSIFSKREQNLDDEFLERRYSPTCNHFDDMMSVQSDDLASLETTVIPFESPDVLSHQARSVTPPVQPAPFCIPELPCGKFLDLVILDTWGDPHYVGLNGLEVFSSTGLPAEILDVTADPADINTLSGYSSDPRVAANLVDGVNLTRDDMHMWLAPFTPGKAHRVRLEFADIITLALVRVWNYNKSRVHSYRGARLVEMLLDGETVFRGEIARACGGDKGAPQAFGDTILFTTREDILEKVSVHDKCFALLGSADTLLEPYFEAPLSRQLPYEAGSERPFTKARGPSVFDKPYERVS